MRLMPNNLTHQPQVLVRLPFDDKHQQRCLRLLSKICKAQEVIPTSFIFQEEFLRVRSVRDRGGFSEVRDGEYLGYTVAIKDLKPNNAGFGKNFMVCLINLVRVTIAELSTSDFVRKLLVGNTYPTRTSCLYWVFLCRKSCTNSASFLNGCPTGI